MAQIFPFMALSPQDFAALGVDQVAYVQPVREQGIEAFAIHAADGRRVAMMPSRETAMAVVIQNDMQPLSVH